MMMFSAEKPFSGIGQHGLGAVEPLCPVFGQCGGCAYQDIPYPEELRVKEEYLKGLLRERWDLPSERFEAIVPSPESYHYRSRLDIKLVRKKAGEIAIGFSNEHTKRHIPIERCFIAKRGISDFIIGLKEQATAKLTAKHRQANLVVKTGDDTRILWGGIGRRSLQLKEEEYLWTEVLGKRIFYSLDTFFQANLSILPKIIERVRAFAFLNEETVLYDLYGGVGLFGLCLADKVREVILIEENKASVALARFNERYHRLDNLRIVEGKVEEKLPALLEEGRFPVAFLDPPRGGLSPAAQDHLSGEKRFSHILYLSCQPATLVRDLDRFVNKNWKIEKIMPFDFFPKTRHVETLVLLKQT